MKIKEFKMNKKISCDIDGILTDYPCCWLEYLASQCGVLYSNVEDAKKAEINYEMIKNKYRCSNFKANLPVNKVAVELLQQIKIKNYFLIMATSRPIDNFMYPELKNMTERWLQKNNIPYDCIVFKNRTADFVHLFDNIEFHIEDDIEYAATIALKNIKTFLYIAHPVFTLGISNIKKENIIEINNLLDILKYL
jgi:uncharacterized HAD superfamily protein